MKNLSQPPVRGEKQGRAHREPKELGGVPATPWLGPRVTFFRALLNEPRSVGAVCPSSGELARRMADWAVPSATGWIVELGGGTGTVTAALLQRGVPPERLMVMERSLHLVNHLRHRFPGLRIVHGDAADITHALLEGQPVATLVSGLPLRSMPAESVAKVVQACTQVLNADSRVVQFTYAPRACSAWSAAGLHRIANESVWRNLPPARIEVFRPPALDKYEEFAL